MRKLKYVVEIEIAENLYAMLEAASNYVNKGITVPETFKRILEENLYEDTVRSDELNATVTYIEQEEQ